MADGLLLCLVNDTKLVSLFFMKKIFLFASMRA